MADFKMRVKLLNTDNAELFVQKCAEFEEDIDYDYGNVILDAKSILGILATDLRNIATVKIHTTSPASVNKFFEELNQWRV